jgi:hypothetical protein
MFAEAEQSDEWIVDLATRRIVRNGCRGAAPSPTLNSGLSPRRNAMSDDKARDQARKDLSPVEDVKGALRFLKDLDPVEEVKEFMETAAEVLDPRRSDIRAVAPDEDTESELLEADIEEDEDRPDWHAPDSGREARQSVREHPQKR